MRQVLPPELTFGALEQRLGLQVPMAALTETLTVAALAHQIAEVALLPTAGEAAGSAGTSNTPPASPASGP